MAEIGFEPLILPLARESEALPLSHHALPNNKCYVISDFFTFLGMVPILPILVQLGNNCAFRFMKTQAGNGKHQHKCRSKKNPKMNIFPAFKFWNLLLFLMLLQVLLCAVQLGRLGKYSFWDFFASFEKKHTFWLWERYPKPELV